MTDTKKAERFKPKFTPAQKAKALELYTTVGPRAAGRQIGCSEKSVRKWVKDHETNTGERLSPPTENILACVKAQEARVLDMRAKLKTQLLEKAVDLLGRMDAPHTDFKGQGAHEVVYPIAPASACLSYATSIGILIDKFRLENGEVTGRDEVITVDKLDREIEKLESELARREPADARAAEPT